MKEINEEELKSVAGGRPPSLLANNGLNDKKKNLKGDIEIK